LWSELWNAYFLWKIWLLFNKGLNYLQNISKFFMGKVSTYLIIIGLIALVPAIVFTIFYFSPQALIPNTGGWFNAWFIGFVIAFVALFLYVVDFGLMILGLIIMKRNSE